MLLGEHLAGQSVMWAGADGGAEGVCRRGRAFCALLSGGVCGSIALWCRQLVVTRLSVISFFVMKGNLDN